MFDYWVVVGYSTGKVIAHCGDESDARMLCELRPTERTYRKQKFIMDQVITISATTDKQLPGQQGLPPAKITIGGQELEVQQSLPESEAKVFHVQV